MTRRQSLFRGSELPRLMILAAVAIAGWPMVLLFAQGKTDVPPPAPPTVPVTQLTPVVPDAGIEFQAVVDRVAMQTRENAAYALLLERARSTPPRDLAAQSRRDLFFTHFWERPERYRGVPVHVEGTALRVLSYEVNPALAPSGRIYEAWVYPDENRALPYVLAFEAAPPNLVIGSDLHLRVHFDGYFLKILGYRASDKPRGAPMFVGQLTIDAPLAAPPAPMVELREMSKRNGVVILFVMLFGYVLVRVAFQVRRAIKPAGRSIALPQRHLTPSEISPSDLSEWLATLPDQDLDDASGSDRGPAPPQSPGS